MLHRAASLKVLLLQNIGLARRVLVTYLDPIDLKNPKKFFPLSFVSGFLPPHFLSEAIRKEKNEPVVH